MKRILIHKPSFLVGNVGDAALIATIKRRLDEMKIPYNIPDSRNEINRTNPDDYEMMVYIGNDCLACYGINQVIIDKFLNMGKTVIFVNVSWKANAKNTSYLRTIESNPNCYIILRDEISFEMFRKALNFRNKPYMGADIAITCNAEDKKHDPKMMDWIDSSSAPIIGINYHRDFDEYNDAVFNELVNLMNNNAEYRYLLIPHDTRKNEHILNTDISKSLKDVDYFESTYMDPEYEKFIMSKCYGVVTGRMHLSILTIPSGVPCIVIAYNGVKARGTLTHWKIDDLVIEPSKISELPSYFDKMIRERDAYSQRIKDNYQTAYDNSYRQIEIIRDVYYGDHVPVKIQTRRIASNDNFEFRVSNHAHDIIQGNVPKINNVDAESNYDYDRKLFEQANGDITSRKYNQMTKTQLIAAMTIDYHRIEKGLAMKDTRPNFGVNSKVLLRLYNMNIEYLKRCETDPNNYHKNDEILQTVYHSIIDYQRWHTDRGYQITCPHMSNYIQKYSWLGNTYDSDKKGGVFTFNKNDLESKYEVSPEFFYSRRSIRDYSDRPVDIELIKKCVDRSLYGTPTVCNRPINRVRIITDKNVMSKVLPLQNGNAGFGDSASAILIVSSALENFQNSTERRQPYIGGGMFCMSLIYALHAEKIATCALNWDVSYERDFKLREILGMENETVIMYIAVGNYPEKCLVAQSIKPSVDDVVIVI